MSKDYKKILEQLEKEGKVIAATNDYVFKSLFQDKEIRPILAYIISQVTKIDKEYLMENMTFKNSEVPKNNISEKENRNDLVVDIKGTTIGLEMNNQNTTDTNFRNISHYHSLITNSIKEATKYNQVVKVIQINFDNERPFTEDLITEIMLVDIKSLKVDEENYKKYRINMAKSFEKYYNKEKLTRFEKILLMLRLDKKIELKALSEGDEELMAMEKKIEQVSKDPDLLNCFDESILNKINAEIEREAYIKENTEKVTEKVTEQVTKEVSQKSKIEIAKKMLDKNMNIDDIAELTTLTKEEIEKITKEK